jgi:predicted secreted protein
VLTAGRAALVAAVAASMLLAVGCSTPERAAGGILVIEVSPQSGEDAERADRAPRRGRMTVGERLEVRLGAYGGTGYAWSLVGPLPANMQLSSRDPASSTAPVAGAEGRPGGATMTTFGMNAVAQGDATLRFELARPWEREKGEPPARTVDVSVEVRPARERNDEPAK